jgi:Arc/MetJ-type ribon-helix-helix transcriptional regulator
MPNKATRPFPIQMEVEFLDRLSEPVREGRVKSVSDLIRTALEKYDFANIVVMHPAQLQISVRLPAEIRRNLRQISRSKHTSIGQLVRAAVEAYLPQIETGAVNQLEMPITPPPALAEPVVASRRPPTRKKKRRKAVAKKPAAKKPAAKKPAAKKPTTKRKR